MRNFSNTDFTHYPHLSMLDFPSSLWNKPGVERGKGGSQKSGVRRQKAEGRRQKAEGRRQKARTPRGEC
jgi:hypothetical protein